MYPISHIHRAAHVNTYRIHYLQPHNHWALPHPDEAGLHRKPPTALRPCFLRHVYIRAAAWPNGLFLGIPYPLDLVHLFYSQRWLQWCPGASLCGCSEDLALQCTKKQPQGTTPGHFHLYISRFRACVWGGGRKVKGVVSELFQSDHAAALKSVQLKSQSVVLMSIVLGWVFWQPPPKIFHDHYHPFSM